MTSSQVCTPRPTDAVMALNEQILLGSSIQEKKKGYTAREQVILDVPVTTHSPFIRLHLKNELRKLKH
jgi:hypothetical protein